MPKPKVKMENVKIEKRSFLYLINIQIISFAKVKEKKRRKKRYSVEEKRKREKNDCLKRRRTKKGKKE